MPSGLVWVGKLEWPEPAPRLAPSEAQEDRPEGPAGGGLVVPQLGCPCEVVCPVRRTCSTPPPPP